MVDGRASFASSRVGECWAAAPVFACLPALKCDEVVAPPKTDAQRRSAGDGKRRRSLVTLRESPAMPPGIAGA